MLYFFADLLTVTNASRVESVAAGDEDWRFFDETSISVDLCVFASDVALDF